MPRDQRDAARALIARQVQERMLAAQAESAAEAAREFRRREQRRALARKALRDRFSPEV